MSLGQDLRFALRLLRRERLLTLVIVATLALAIGASTSVFSVVYEVLLRPLPYPAPEQLVRLYQASPEQDRGWGLSYPALTAWRARVHGLGAVEGMGFQDMTLTGEGPAAPVRTARATAGLLPQLGVRPVLGQLWGAEAEVPGRDRVVLLSHAMWRTQLGSDPRVLGRTLTLDGVPHTVVGVLPADFRFDPAIDLWKPLAPEPATEAVDAGHHFLRGLGRLRPGVSAQAARAEMEQVAKDFVREGGPPGARVEPLHGLLVKGVRTQLWLLAGVVAFVLLVACANVANLLLARATAREREVAVRAALGAGRWQLVRQFLVEGLLLAFAGGGLGLLLAAWGRELLRVLVPPELVSPEGPQLSSHLLLLTAALSLLTCLLAALVPALRAARADGRGTLGDLRGARSTGGGGGLRAALVVVQVSLALVPLVGAGLMLRTLQRLDAAPLGFEPQGVVLAELRLDPERFATERLAPLYEELRAHVQGLPGVRAVGLASTVPLWGRNGFSPILRPGEPMEAAKGREPVNFRAVDGDYLEALRIPLREGRRLGAQDGAGSPPVMLVNEAFVRRYFPHERVLGQQARLALDDESPLREIVGVVGDVRHEGLAEAPVPEVYMPLSQFAMPRMVLAVRSDVEPAALTAMLRAQVQGVVPDLPLLKVRSMPELVDANLERTRALGALFTALAVLGLLLAAVGLYGVLAYSVTQRTRELGIRAALGARQEQLLGLVLRQGLGLAGLGVGVGLLVAGLLARTLGGLVYGVPVLDPVTFGGVPALLLGVALLASWVPARRALRVPPHEALRSET
ncbi:ABC transporter permease [Aggregicoccus sp. 17bor-14]|uniref:ABC transporter permease n=1 Tax=Myxococcaceae TaxID=31 RepID=UPI00129CE809|nr:MULTISPECIES: ABC transporter permease [Myxococcaceae]MBF5041921.1 ABC transporter permease [Simulacricoccus sp. 17bor-14]MRI87702.1 ABC transporter permease [Aggregicoccus sp. 17bor-14]